jgi:hypothetical protein
MDDRMKALKNVATRITPAILNNTASMQTFLEDRPALESMFSGGVYVTRSDGTVIADFPTVIGRIGINYMDYMDREWMAEVLKGKPAIGKPVMGKTLHAPVFVIAEPIRDTKGKVIGVLAGVINLGAPNCINKVTDNSFGKTGGYLLISPQHNLYVTATDKSRIMQPLPAPGINPMHDRYMHGIEELSAAKHIPVVGWFVVAVLPAEDAFAPIHAMQQRMLLALIFLTLLASSLTWWMLKRQLAPVFTTIKTLASLADSDQPPQPLPITRQNEIGDLIGGFNRLLETLRQREEALRCAHFRLESIIEGTHVGT